MDTTDILSKLKSKVTGITENVQKLFLERVSTVVNTQSWHKIIFFFLFNLTETLTQCQPFSVL